MRPVFTPVVLAAVLMALAPHAARAQVFGFDCITDNRGADCAAGQSQLTVEVKAAPAGSVDFVFRNAGPAASSITDVYFDDGTLLALASVWGSSGVSFSQGASPPNLPGGNAIGFQTTAGFLADSDAPVAVNGVNPGESLTVRFTLQPGLSFADTVLALQGGSALRIGVHVQAFAGGGSESFVNLASPVPEASTWLMWAAGLAAIGTRLRKRR